MVGKPSLIPLRKSCPSSANYAGPLALHHVPQGDFSVPIRYAYTSMYS